MLKNSNSKKRAIVVVVVVAIVVFVAVFFDKQVLPDWLSPVAVDASGDKSKSQAVNTLEKTSISVPSLGGSDLDKEVVDIQRNGDLLIERADALVAKYRKSDDALVVGAMKQRIDDVKARLDQSKN